VNDLDDTPPFTCPRCKVAFSVEYKYHWLHILLAIGCGWFVAHFQGLHSIVFCGAWVIYSAAGMLVIGLLGFPLKLPKRFTMLRSNVQSLGIDPKDQ
jgi:hypothetical protein